MKIDTSAISLNATHSASAHDEVRETLRAWVGDKRPDFEAMDGGQKNPPAVPAALVSISAAARDAGQAASATVLQSSKEAQAVADAANDIERDPKFILIKLLVEMLTGNKIKIMSTADVQGDQHAVTSPAPPASEPAKQPEGQQRAGFGVEYDRHQVHEETEQTTFQAHGSIHTADGQKIDFDIALAMNRSYREQSDVSVRAGDGIRKDPLVINFNGAAAQLQSQRFSFDLDGNGKAENVPLLSGSSGYLALDRNNNGKVDSGTELFGTASGNGFADLARYDSDGNGWIDENDPIFGSLRIWSPDGALRSLAERGVGALSLAHSDTPFELKDDANKTLGAVRASGVYLAENGSAGTLQQIDLMI